MDIRLKDNDLFLSGDGSTEYVRGIDEAAQRVLIACSVRKASFLYDRELGVQPMAFEKDDRELERKVGMLFSEAVYKIPDVSVSVLYIKRENDQMTAVTAVERKGEKRTIEVRVNGEL